MSLANRVKENPKGFVEPQEVGGILNEYFVLVFTKEKDMTNVEVRDECVNILENVNILKEVVLGFLTCIMIDKYPRSDGIYLP
eukprot:g17659.t1